MKCDLVDLCWCLEQSQGVEKRLTFYNYRRRPDNMLTRPAHFFKKNTTMVLGRKGMRLEAYKFGLYISVPIFASIIFNEPEVQKWCADCADYFKFLMYPANPNTNLREEFEQLAKQRELEKEKRAKYAEEVQRMQDNARRSREGREAALKTADENGSELQGGSWNWLRWPVRRTAEAAPVESNQTASR